MKFIKYIFLTLLIFSCDDDSDLIDAGTSELQGSWSGSMINMSDPNIFTFTFTDNNFELNGLVYNMYDSTNVIPVIGSGTFTINNQLAPNEMDIIITSYEVAGQPVIEYSDLTSLCIYQIEGDTLSFSGAEPGTSQRPTNFTGNEGGMQVYLLIRN